MTAECTDGKRIGLVAAVLRDPPPESCAGTCLAYMTDTCATCPQRAIRAVDIAYGQGMCVEDAIREGLVTPEQVAEFRRQVTGGQ